MTRWSTSGSFVRRRANWRLAFELASLIQHDAKIGSDPVLLGELSDLLSHDLDQPDADPKLTQYLALTLGAFRTLEAKTSSRSSGRSARSARASAGDEVPDTDPDRGCRQPGKTGGAAGWQARRRASREGTGRGGGDRRAGSSPDGSLCAGFLRGQRGH